jgi:hypothetical protein
MTQYLSNFDTCRGSILHRLFTRSPITRIRIWRDRILPYSATVFIFAAVPAMFALMTLPEALKPSPTLQVPYFRDWNVLFMFTCTLPLIVTLLLTERHLIPFRIASVEEANVLYVDPVESKELLKKWETVYRRINILSQPLGLLVGAVVSFANYLVISGGKFLEWQFMKAPDHDFLGWQLTDESINAVGWLYLLWQLPVFYSVVVMYVARAITTVCFLRKLTKISKTKLQALHPDNAAGLGPIGKIGLRNQYEKKWGQVCL